MKLLSCARAPVHPIEQQLTHRSPGASLSTPIPRISTLQTFRARRTFSHTPLLLKKKGRAEREKEEEEAEKSSGVVEDPFDFSTLEAGIEKGLEKLKNDLSKLRTGGRFNPELLENVRVHLSKDSKATERLGDLAQVLPKGGRSLMVLVGEKDVSNIFEGECWKFVNWGSACQTDHFCNSGLEGSESTAATRRS